MGFLLGGILMIVGIGIVILGTRRDLDQCHDDRQRSIVWTFTAATIAGVMITWLLVSALPGWLAWLPWMLLLGSIAWAVSRLQGIVGPESGTES